MGAQRDLALIIFWADRELLACARTESKVGAHFNTPKRCWQVRRMLRYLFDAYAAHNVVMAVSKIRRSPCQSLPSRVGLKAAFEELQNAPSATQCQLL